MRLVNTPTPNSMPSTRYWSSACEDTSTTAWVAPAVTASAISSASSTGLGVVVDARTCRATVS